MSDVKRKAILGGLLGATAVLTWWAYASWYAGPMTAKSADLAATRESIARYEELLDARREVRSGLKDIAATTLGSRIDTVEHRFRSLLTAVAQDCGLQSVEVTSGTPERMKNPAGSSRLDDRRLLSTFREQIDGYVIRGQVSAAGSLEQVLGVMAALRAQPWVGRVESFRLTPEGRNRDRFTVRVSVSTLFVPDLADPTEPEPTRVTLSEEDRRAFASIVSKNMFKEPAPVRIAETPPKPAPPKPDPGPPAPAYHEWRLSGISESPRQGVQAMFVNTRTNEYVFLSPGEMILDVTFVEGEGELATLSHAENLCELSNGQTLDQRRVTGTIDQSQEGAGISRRP